MSSSAKNARKPVGLPGAGDECAFLGGSVRGDDSVLSELERRWRRGVGPGDSVASEVGVMLPGEEPAECTVASESGERALLERLRRSWPSIRGRLMGDERGSLAASCAKNMILEPRRDSRGDTGADSAPPVLESASVSHSAASSRSARRLPCRR